VPHAADDLFLFRALPRHHLLLSRLTSTALDSGRRTSTPVMLADASIHDFTSAREAKSWMVGLRRP